MSQDFNTKDLGDFGYKDVPLLTSDIDCFKQEIETLFYTEPTEVINSEDWLDIRSLVFDRSVSKEFLQGQIEDLINSSCGLAKDFQFDIDVKFIEGTSADIGVIEVKIWDNKGARRTSQFVIA